MLVNSSNPVTSILKRKRCDSTSEQIEFKKPQVETVAEQCSQLLERLHVTGEVYASFSSELLVLGKSDAEVQLSWLTELAASTAMFGHCHNFVLTLLEVDWKLSESSCLRTAYRHFLFGIATTHTSLCRPVLHHIFSKLVFDTEDPDRIQFISPHVFSVEETTRCEILIDTVVDIITKLPSCHELVLKSVCQTRPYYKKHPHTLLLYNKSLLSLGERVKCLRTKLLEHVLHSIISLDLICPRESLQPEDNDDLEDRIFDMDMEETDDQLTEKRASKQLQWMLDNPLGHSLDVLMRMMFLYNHCLAHGIPFTLATDADSLNELSCPLGSTKCSSPKGQMNAEDDKSEGEGISSIVNSYNVRGCQCGGALLDIEALKQFYIDLRDNFVRVILTADGPGHVQYIMFHLLSLKPGLVSIFIEHLRTNYFLDVSKATDIRKNAMSFIGSLLVRGKFVPFSLVYSCLDVIVNWCHLYVKNQETRLVNNFPDATIHQVFYSACQTVFYVFTFRYQEFTCTRNRLDSARSLNLENLIFSKLNPLAMCTQAIVNNFAAVTRFYQLAYCYSIIERNKRHTLPVMVGTGLKVLDTTALVENKVETFFPFEPYLLPDSAQFISELYHQFSGLPECISDAAELPMDGVSCTDSRSIIKSQSNENEEDDFLDQSGPRNVNFLTARFHLECDN